MNSNHMRLEEKAAQTLIKHKKTLATAESCTGGLLADRLTNVPGSSAFFLLGVISYDNAAKIKILKIPSILLKKHGAVSREVVHEMWTGVLLKTGADYGIAVTGIAGPKGGTPKKPVGTIFYALGKKGEMPAVGTLHFKGNRQTVILRTTKWLFCLFLKKIL